LADNDAHLTLTVVVIIIVLVLGSGCGDSTDSKQSLEATTGARGTKTATIRVTGTSGTPFKGSYASASTSTQSVEGEIPQDYEVSYNSPSGTFDRVEASMQKRVDDYSKLTVQIIVESETKKEQTTAAGFGVAKVSWHPSEQ
jgi:hypothetical protein